MPMLNYVVRLVNHIYIYYIYTQVNESERHL